MPKKTKKMRGGEKPEEIRLPADIAQPRKGEGDRNFDVPFEADGRGDTSAGEKRNKEPEKGRRRRGNVADEAQAGI